MVDDANDAEDDIIPIHRGVLTPQWLKKHVKPTRYDTLDYLGEDKKQWDEKDEGRWDEMRVNATPPQKEIIRRKLSAEALKRICSFEKRHQNDPSFTTAIDKALEEGDESDPMRVSSEDMLRQMAIVKNILEAESTGKQLDWTIKDPDPKYCIRLFDADALPDLAQREITIFCQNLWYLGDNLSRQGAAENIRQDVGELKKVANLIDRVNGYIQCPIIPSGPRSPGGGGRGGGDGGKSA